MGGSDSSNQPDVMNASPEDLAQFKMSIAGQQDAVFTNLINGATNSGSGWNNGMIPVDNLVNQFKDWKKKNDAEQQQHDEYVKATQDRPGRQATIVADKTIAAADPTKTILG